MGSVLFVRPHRSTTYVDAAYCYRPSSVVCRSVTLVSPAETAAPIEMTFGLRTRVSAGNHVLDFRDGFFVVMLSDEDIADIECLKVIAMATNFWTKIAINWLCVNDSDQTIGYGGGFEWLTDRMQILPIPCC